MRKDLLHHLGRGGLATALAEGRVVPFSRSVLIIRDRMLDFRTRCAAALLSAGRGAVLGRETAIYLYGCTAAGSDRVHLLLPYDRKIRTRSDITVHYGRFDDADVEEVDGLRCLILDAAIAEMLCRGERSTALACADQAMALAPIADRPEIKASIGYRIDHRDDPRGSRQGHYLLDLVTGLPESPAESWLLLKLADAGLPLPEPQHPIRDLNGREIWRLDFAWPEARVALEYDGYEAHVNKRRDDAARDEDLRRRGWKVIRADVSDLRDPTRLIGRLKVELRVSERRTRPV
ncbi:DUF559 domain-containing protein [Lentzea sp. NBRC 105346]|uniref:endonuclease domain-containing protein n=1 Tax=Lentzea sp. NBRC 105346 TaxID=3032205 RepID=UPI002553AC42|nr:DUF559 domain-containing protein [Lentzea sp. NBRC 105346]